jgi:integrase
LETDYRLRRVRSLRQVLAHLKPIRQRFSHVKAVTITPAVVDRYIEERLAPRQAADRVFSGKAPATVNRETQLLGQALRLGVARRLLSSAPELRKLSEAGNVRQGFLAPADFEAVVAQLPEDLRDFARFGYASAWRRGELASLLWSDVDLADRVVRLRAEESKNGQTRLLPLEGQLLEIIQRREAARVITVDGQTRLVPYVFHRGGRPVVDFRKAWKRACRAAGVAGQLFHDLRRSGVRNLIRAGVDPSVAMTLSGHKTRAMLDRYNIIDERDLRAAILRTDSYVKAQPVERGVLPLRTGTGGGAR